MRSEDDHGGGTVWTVIDRRDGFDLCHRETMRAPFATREEAQRLADTLNRLHPAKPHRVTQRAADSTAKYLRQE